MFKWVMEDKRDVENFNEIPVFMFSDIDVKVEHLGNSLNINGESLYIIQTKNITRKIFEYIDILIDNGIDAVIYYPCDPCEGIQYDKLQYITKTLYFKKVPCFWNVADLNIFLGYCYSVLKLNSDKTILKDGILAVVSALEGLHHTKMVSMLSQKMAILLSRDKQFAEQVALAGLIHDIGKMFIPSSILNKKGKLTSSERKVMEFHTIWGGFIVEQLKFLDQGIKKVARNICAFHHERCDGTGYPYGLKQNEIPLEAQIVAIVDVYDALISNRPYRSAVDKDIAISYIKANKDKFGEENIKAFLSIL
ncbi:HD domain-containing protein [Thermodesulfovibrio sp. 1176]|uniref:HD-GYP domain-containing protein n=1 Tax=Thermodesulfovibrio sp. 1176 TaxID=3043424 RepID=UPI0024827B7F|nr:HD domain-containing phosphohydrolase [Thermodesulfovibrio sp. 1176]MDI1472932.1 HD domain-containing protein [Thermodesulfovibrio sp. 1176]